ncbi:molybdenum cofactor guanylyltransferase [Paenibacillus pasadenensis]|uniref:molybdenum cofactor guanylyltransferase n=1 Tax=Paenibacillus pasadenensis TaxID=217090 RepID=UPI00204099D7|nr:molybdenum cofactor guanylyltransferase [Paenibacillus pasadenensis]MCM3748649.1 molybdenum cofactor guanylyltransferase [Paenibacillus pasadenensis]
MTGDMELEGVILAGGLSRRMGEDKFGLTLGSRTLLSRIARRMGAVCSRVTVVVADEVQARRVRAAAPELPPPLVERYAGCGPLAGVHAALLAAKSPYVWTVACDMPFVIAPGALELAEKLRSGSAGCAVPLLDGRLQPLHGVYRREGGAAAAEILLAAGEYRLQRLLGLLEAETVDAGHWLEQGFDKPLFALNLNTREEYMVCLELAERMEQHENGDPAGRL